MSKSKIDYIDYSWNPMLGCKHNCTKKTIGFDCYAEVMNRRFKMIPDWREPQFFHDRILKTGLPRKPSIIFVGSMTDIMGNWWSREQINAVLSVIRSRKEHIFMLLTKNPKRYVEFDYPTNVMLGQTITKTNKSYDTILGDFYQLNKLQQRGYKVFFSIEPLLGKIDYEQVSFADLLIVGADTSKNPVIPKEEWIDYLPFQMTLWKSNIRKYYPELPEINKDIIWKLFKNNKL